MNQCSVLISKFFFYQETQPRSQGLSSLPPLSLRKDFSQRQWRQRRETLGTRLQETQPVNLAEQGLVSLHYYFSDQRIMG